jgi:hypothetical protein
MESSSSAKSSNAPFFVGMSAPQVCTLFSKYCNFQPYSAIQGCGKTTFTDLLSQMFKYCNLRCISMSLDDFYLRGEKQDALALENSGNPLLQYRGNGIPPEIAESYNRLIS